MVEIFGCDLERCFCLLLHTNTLLFYANFLLYNLCQMNGCEIGVSKLNFIELILCQNEPFSFRDEFEKGRPSYIY